MTASKIYRLLELADPAGSGVLFRVSSGGRFDRWDAARMAWIHVDGQAGREYLSRAVENGEAIRSSAQDAR